MAPDGSWLASAGDDAAVRIWGPRTGQARHALTGHTDLVRALAVAPDGSWLASAGDDAAVRIWDPRTGQARHVLTGHTSRVEALAVAPDGSWLASAGYDHTVRIWNVGGRRCVASLRTGYPLRRLVSDGVRVIVAGDRFYFLATA